MKWGMYKWIFKMVLSTSLLWCVPCDYRGSSVGFSCHVRSCFRNVKQNVDCRMLFMLVLVESQTLINQLRHSSHAKLTSIFPLFIFGQGSWHTGCLTSLNDDPGDDQGPSNQTKIKQLVPSWQGSTKLLHIKCYVQAIRKEIDRWLAIYRSKEINWSTDLSRSVTQPFEILDFLVI